MNILSIGNSFSQDAHRYLHKIAKADGVNINTFNLYIGGCSLSLHYRNMISEERAYTLEMNGESTGFKVSLKNALLNRDWDVVTIQQASRVSTDYETYQPYINEIVNCIKECVPKAKIAIHQTWAYEQDSPALKEKLGYAEHTQMFEDVKASYQKAFEGVNADMIIQSGEVLQRLIAFGVEKVHRDTCHLSYGIGRYAVGLLWYSLLTENDVINNTFCDFDEEISEEDVGIIKACVSGIHRTAQK